LQVWLAFVVEEIDRCGLTDAEWLAASAGDWRVAAAVNDLGATLPVLGSDEQIQLGAVLRQARERAVHTGDLSARDLGAWLILDSLPVAMALPRSPDSVVGVSRVLDVADGFARLHSGTFPPDPPGHWWLLGGWDPESQRTLRRRTRNE
jgi:hypothetical protein